MNYVCSIRVFCLFIYEHQFMYRIRHAKLYIENGQLFNILHLQFTIHIPFILLISICNVCVPVCVSVCVVCVSVCDDKSLHLSIIQIYINA